MLVLLLLLLELVFEVVDEDVAAFSGPLAKNDDEEPEKPVELLLVPAVPKVDAKCDVEGGGALSRRIEDDLRALDASNPDDPNEKRLWQDEMRIT